MLARDSKPSMLLQQPGRMGALRLKNRVVMGPMGTNFGTTDGFSTERDKIYYAERARGGAAMIITEAMVVSGNARNHRASLCIFDKCPLSTISNWSKRSGRHHDRIRLRALCYPLCHP